MAEDWLRAQPARAGPYALDGWLRAEAGDLVSARSRYQQALSRDPVDVHALVGLGRVYEKLNRPERALVLVLRPEGKRAFAAVTLSPITGVISGMNDAGLCVTLNEVLLKQSKDKAKFDWNGVPTLSAFRRVLEECKTVGEAEKLLRGMKRMTTACMTVCDPAGGAVFEITPKSLEVRTAENGVCCCTNHFCTDPLNGDNRKCGRLEKLTAAQKADDKLSVDDVFARLHAVNQGKKTIQAMVFEPATKTLHLKVGDGKESATGNKAVKLDKLFEK